MCLFNGQGYELARNDDHRQSTTPQLHPNPLDDGESYINAGSLSSGDYYIALGVQSGSVYYFEGTQSRPFDASAELAFSTSDSSTVNVVGQQLHSITNTNNTAANNRNIIWFKFTIA